LGQKNRRQLIIAGFSKKALGGRIRAILILFEKVTSAESNDNITQGFDE
jgi:hypothetical protein